MELVDPGGCSSALGTDRPVRRRGRRAADSKADLRSRGVFLGHGGGRHLDRGAVVSRLRRHVDACPRKAAARECAVGRATVLALLLVGALFMLQTWVATDLARGMHFSSADTAFYEIAERAGGAWLRLVTIVAVVLASAIANAMAAQAAVARILFAMARDGKLPAVLAKVHPRFKTPYVSTLAVAGVSMLVGLLFSERVDDLTRSREFRRAERLRAAASVGDQSLFHSRAQRRLDAASGVPAHRAGRSFSTCCTRWTVRRRFSAPAGSRSVSCIFSFWRTGRSGRLRSRWRRSATNRSIAARG